MLSTSLWPCLCAIGTAVTNSHETMTDREPKNTPERDRNTGESVNDEIIPGRHGKHGGSLESEGSPQEPIPESNEQPKHDDGGKNKH